MGFCSLACFLLQSTSGFADFRHANQNVLSHESTLLRRRIHQSPILSRMQSKSDDTSASTRISNSQAMGLLLDFGHDVDDADIAKLATLLDDFGYCHSSIKRIFNVTANSAYPFGPTYLKPLSPGDVFELPMGEDIDKHLTSLQCFVALFLLSSCIEMKTFVEVVHFGRETLGLFLRLNLVFVDEGYIVPLVHLYALDIPSGDNLVIATDLNPSVLRRTSFSETEGAVMYIGPDSISLVQHLEAGIKKHKANGESLRVLDLCTGSGVQALATMAMLSDVNSSSVVADINERALRFAMFNAKLNGFGDRLVTNQVNLLDESDRKRLLQAERYDIVLANPSQSSPFIPTPPSRSDRPALLVREESDSYRSGRGQNRSQMQNYGLFSSGGVDGEDCLRSVIELAPHLLNEGGILAIVSEFMNPDDEQNQNCAARKICKWWGSNAGVGMLFTNQFPLSAKIYAERRALTNDVNEATLWLTHLKEMNINEVSPGLLFILLPEGGENDSAKLFLDHRIVPKSEIGSIWTPHNKNAIDFTSDKLNELFS